MSDSKEQQQAEYEEYDGEYEDDYSYKRCPTLDTDTPLTVAKATEVFEHIRAICRDDDDAAHSLEDKIKDVLVAQIDDGVLKDLAEIKAITSVIRQIRTLKFARWCA